MTDSQNPKIFTKQEKIAKDLGISIDDLQSKILKIQPSENKVTKKEILSVIIPRQKELVEFYLDSREDKGLTIQHLDPRQNRYNSVRYQYLKTAGHYLGEKLTNWDCHQGCGYFTTQTMLYFISFGDEPLSICVDQVHADDKTGIGSRPSTSHLLDKHAEFVGKRLKGMGVKTK